MGPFLSSTWPFLTALVALCVFAGFVGDSRMRGTALVLFLNWATCSGLAAFTGDPYPWGAFATVDYIAGFTVLVLLRAPTTAWQAIVGLIYAGELIAHGARGIIGTPTAVYYGWYFLSYAAWAQVAAVAVWGVYELARRGVVSDRRPSSRRAIAGGDHSIEASRAREV